MFRFVWPLFLVMSFVSVAPAVATEQNRDLAPDQIYAQSADRNVSQLQTAEQDPDGEEIYGSQLMTDRERAQYREQLDSMLSPAQRERFRQQHYQNMQRRAATQGETLLDVAAPPQ